MFGRAPRACLRAFVLGLWLCPQAAHAAPDDATRAREAWRQAVSAWVAGHDALVDAWAEAHPAALLRLRATAARLVDESPDELLREGVRLHLIAAHAAETLARQDVWQAHHDLLDKLVERGARRERAPAQVAAWRALWRQARLARAYDLLSRWRPTRAKQALDELLARLPDDGEALLALGFAETLRATVPTLERERYVIWDAAEGAWRAQQHDVTQRQADKRGSLNAARRALRRALTVGAQAANAHLLLGRLAASEGDHDEAEREWRAALDDAQADEAALAHVYLARAAELRKAAPEALAHYRAAVAVAPHARAARLGLSAALGRAGERAEALLHVQAILALQSDPGDTRQDPWLRLQFQPGDGPRALFAALRGRP